MGAWRVVLTYVLFAVSGATSLAYEVVWTRLLIRVFGSTSFAVTTVLASYMAGLALGSFLLGRWIDRPRSTTHHLEHEAMGKRETELRHPLRVYGLLELGIGVFALLFPYVIMGLNGIYDPVYSRLSGSHYLLPLVRFVLSFLVLLVPTTLMGGTLPVLAKFITHRGSGLAGRIGVLYAVNTLGAAAGAFAAGYTLLPRLGINHTTWLCAILNLAILAGALALAGRGRFRRTGDESKPLVSGHEPAVNLDSADAMSTRGKIPSRDGGEAGRWRRRAILTAFMLTGFAALAAEVIWTRALSLVIGTTVYAFSAMLATFLLGLALGSAALSKIARRARQPGTVLAAVVTAIGLSVFATSIAFGNLPILYLRLGQVMVWDWGMMMWAQFILCLLVLLLPTFLMGATFPLVIRLCVTDSNRVGTGVGTAYAFNTVGSILGSFAGSFILLRFLGMERSLAVVGTIYLAVGLALVLSVAEMRGHKRTLAAAVAALLAAGLFLPPRWDPKMMTSAAYRHAQIYDSVEDFRESVSNRLILFYDDGPGATVTVERSENEISLAIDGKSDASTGMDDMTTQTMLAHLPLLAHPDPDTVLVIGLGCGVSLGSAEQYPLRRIDCVELLENVTRASRYFAEYNYRCLDDPRVNLILADARSHLLLSDQQYDVIISEPTNPWIAGVGDLFTREFFEAAKRRLKPDGIMCAWTHIYQMGDRDMRAIARTFLHVFPEASMWMLNQSDVVFLGSSRRLPFGAAMADRMASPAVRDDLLRIHVDDIADVLSGYVWGKDGLRRYAGPAGEMHTDDNMMLEYSVARNLFSATEAEHMANFANSMEPPPLEGLSAETAKRVLTQIGARQTAIRGTLKMFGNRYGEGIALYDAAFAQAPDDPYVLSVYVEGHLALAGAYFGQGDYRAAAESYRKATADPDWGRAWAGYEGLASCYIQQGNLASSREFYELSLDRNPYNRSSAHNLARLYLTEGDVTSAVSVYQRTLALFPQDAEAADGLARLYAMRNEHLDEALRLARIAARGDKAAYYNTLGWVSYARGELSEAERALKAALRLEPDDSEALYRLGLAEMASHNNKAARKTLERLMRLGRGDEYSDKARKLLREFR